MKAPSTTPGFDSGLCKTIGGNGLRHSATVPQTEATLFSRPRHKSKPSQGDRILSLLQQYPGATAAEVNRFGDCKDLYEASRRLPELERRGLCRRGDVRICRVTGRPSQTWYPTNK